MLNKPKFMSPSTNMSECVMDASADSKVFSCIVDGSESVVSWRIKIYTLASNTMVYDSGKVSTQFYPVDEKNRNVIFKADISDHANTLTNAAAAFTNSDKPYYWTIQFTGSSGAEVTSCEEVFYANPKFSITVRYSTDNTTYSNLSSGSEKVISTRQCYFKAVCGQKDSMSLNLKRYGWRITDSTDTVLLDTISKNQVYGMVDNILCHYEGFANNETYYVEVSIETQNGDILKTEPLPISVSYETTVLTSEFKTEALLDEPGIINDWGNANIIMGEAYGDISYKNNYPINGNKSVIIPKDSRIEYTYGSNSELNISENSYIVLSTQIPESKNITLLEMSGTDSEGNVLKRKLFYSVNKFIYEVTVGAETVRASVYPEYTPSPYVWYIITMSPIITDNRGINTVELTVNARCTDGGLYPSESLYPSDSLYPSFGEWEVKTYGI